MEKSVVFDRAAYVGILASPSFHELPELGILPPAPEKRQSHADFATKREVREAEQRLKEEIEELRLEMREEIAAARLEARKEAAELRARIAQEAEAVQAEVARLEAKMAFIEGLARGGKPFKLLLAAQVVFGGLVCLTMKYFAT